MSTDWNQGDVPASLVALADEPKEVESQINVPPRNAKGLWKVITSALRCPACGSTSHKAETGRRQTPDGLTEQYRRCRKCSIRFRAVFE